MKKIFFVVILFVALSFNCNAQENKTVKKDFTEIAQRDAYELAETVELNQEQAESFVSLFVMKYDTLSQNLSEERNTELLRIVDLKIRASLTAEQIQKYDANTALKTRLLSKEIN